MMDPDRSPSTATTHALVERGVAALRRRVAIGVFLGGFAEAVGALALAGAAGVVVARLFGVTLGPSPYWLVLLVPAAVFGALRVRSRGLDSASAAHHLDQRLSMAALLSTSVETDASAWSQPLSAGVAKVDRALPSLRWGRYAICGLAPAAVLAATWLFPPPEVAGPLAPNPLFREALARFERKVDLLEKEKVIEPEPLRESRERLEALAKKAESGEQAPWSDLDALAEKLARATDEKAASLDRLSSDLSELALGNPGSDPAESEADRLAELAQAAHDAGLFARIDPELAKKLGLDQPGAKLDASKLAALDAKTMKELAKALSGAAAARLGELARAGLVDAKGFADLASLLAGNPSNDPFRNGDKMCPTCHGKRPEECGT